MLIVGFSYPKKFKIGAWLIAKWTGKPYSHVYLKFPSSRIPSTIYHAAHGMVHFRTEANFLKDNDSIREIELITDESTKHKVLAHAMNIAGEPYGYTELVKIFISDIKHFLCKHPEQSYDGKGYICSELVGEILQDLYGYKFDKPLHLLKPSDIEEAMDHGKA